MENARLVNEVRARLLTSATAVTVEQMAAGTGRDPATVRRWIARHRDADITAGFVTTVEQTLLDIADRTELGGLDEPTVSDILISLAPGADGDHVAVLAEQQRRRGAFARARWVVDGIVAPHAPTPPVPRHRDRYADPRGLQPARPTAAEPFGVREPNR